MIAALHSSMSWNTVLDMDNSITKVAFAICGSRQREVGGKSPNLASFLEGLATGALS